MKSQTEEILWIAAQEDSLLPREIVYFALNNNFSFSKLLEFTQNDFKGVSATSVQKFFQKTEHIDVEKYQNIWNSAYEQDICLIPYDNHNFPKKLHELNSSPAVLLYHQGLHIPYDNCVAVVGTRNCSTHAAEFTRDLSQKLAIKGHTIVAGLAEGIDSIAHRSAISVKGKTIAVLAWMFNPYPKWNRQLLSEITKNGFAISDTYFTSKIGLERGKFVHRNEIISGISEVLVAVESSDSGGTAHQVEIAKRQNKLIITLEPEENNEVANKGYRKFMDLGAIPVNSVEKCLEIIENHFKKIQEKLPESTLFDYSK